MKTHDQKRFLLGALNMTLSGFSLSLVILFSGLALSTFPLVFLIFLRFFLPCLLLFLFLLFLKGKIAFKAFIIQKRDLGKIARAILIVGSQLSILYYLSIGTLLDATALLNTGPLFIPLLERLFLRRKIGKSTAVAMVVSAIGVYFILRPELSIFQLASLIGILGGLLQAGSQILFGIYANEEETGLISLFRLFLFCSFLSFVVLLFFPADYLSTWNNFSKMAWIYLILLAIVTIFNQYFRSRAYFYGKPSTLACFFYTSIVFSIIFDWLIFQRKPDLLSFVGAFLVILGGILKIYLRHIILKKKKL